MKPIAIIGAGNSGFAMAGHLSGAGLRVRIWNRPENDPFTPVRKAGGILVSGVIEGLFLPELMSSDVARVLQGTELILVTVPANSHEAVMAAMAPHLVDGQTILLNPGRTCGATCCLRLLRRLDCHVDVTLAETQTIVYTCRKTSETSVSIVALKDDVFLAAIPADRTQLVLQSLPDCLRRHFVPAENIVQTSLGNVGMILHCMPMLLNAGQIESPKAQFKYYYDGITPTVARALETLDGERIQVAHRLGASVPDVVDWMKRVYHTSGRDLYDCIQANLAYSRIDAPKTLKHRYLLEDVPTGLVPLEAIGKALGLPLALTTLTIDLACRILDQDFRASGRNAPLLGIAPNMSVDEIRYTICGRNLPLVHAGHTTGA